MGMHEKLEKLLKYIKELQKKEYTGQLRINFHRGNIAIVLEMKNTIKLGDEGDSLTRII